MKKEAVLVPVKDQFPVSVIKEISVSDKKAPEGNIDEETGIVRWNLKLSTGEKKKLRFGYTVMYPKGRIVMLE